ncbi:MAG: DUF4838 domain-containing protein [Bryobacteraceae bacterium]
MCSEQRHFYVACTVLAVFVALLAPTAFAQKTANPVTIVTAADAGETERFAAAELAKYLAKMGNPQPKIVKAPAQGEVYLGVLPGSVAPSERRLYEDPIAGRDPDSFLIRSFARGVVIKGNSPRAVLFGTYHYLESLGARWYFPGTENELIPQVAVRLTGFDTVQVPSFRKRGIVVFASTPGFASLVDFAAKVKLNTIGLHDTSKEYDAYSLASKAIGARGLTIDAERHLFGERFCPDDTAALATEKERFKSYIATLPSQLNDFFLWVADKELPPCASPKYRNYSVSDLVMYFSNEIAQTLRRTRPQGRYAYLAYLGTEPPPKNVKPGPGVLLEWAPMRQCFAHSFDDPDCPMNRAYRQNIEGYLKLFKPEDAQVLGYWLDDTLFNRTGYGRLPYRPDVLKADLTYLHKLRVPDVTTFGVITGANYFASHVSPAVFLYPRLLWDVTSDPQSVMKEFCQGFFGDGDTLKVFDLLAEADRLVYVDKHQVQARMVNDPAFIAAVSEAIRLSQTFVTAQTDPRLRGRRAKLLQEVAERFSKTGK